MKQLQDPAELLQEAAFGFTPPPSAATVEVNTSYVIVLPFAV